MLEECKMTEHGTKTVPVSMTEHPDPFGSSLPLIQVDLRLLLAETSAINAATAVTIYEALREVFPTIVIDHPSEVAPGKGPNIRVRQTPLLDSMMLRNEHLIVLVHEDMLVLRWQADDVGEKSTYPGFAKMFTQLHDIVTRLVLDTSKLAGVNMSYTNIIIGEQEGRIMWFLKNRWLISELYPHSDSLRLECASRFSDGVEYRVTCDAAVHMSGQNGYLLKCVAGIASAGSQWPQEMDRVHTRLVELFEAVISQEAEKAWKQ